VLVLDFGKLVLPRACGPSELYRVSARFRRAGLCPPPVRAPRGAQHFRDL